MKKIFSKFSLAENIVLIASFVIYTILAIFINTLDGWIAWASCVTYLVFLIMNANSKYMSFVWLIVSFLIYMYFNIKEMFWGELALSAFSIIINFVAMLQWKKHTKDEKLEIITIKTKEFILSILITLVSSVALYFILKLLNSSQLLLNTIILSITLLEYYYTFRRTYLKFYVGLLSVAIYIVLWNFSINPANNFALMFVINGFLNIFWYIDGICIWKKIQKNEASKK